MNTYCYKGNDLGLTYSSGASMFKVWAPTARKVTLVLYENEGQYDSNGYVLNHSDGTEFEMNVDEGIWYITIEGDFDGKFYLYKVELENETNYRPDPYSIAVSANGQRSAIVNMKCTNPEGWERLKYLTSKPVTESVIMELNVRDFSMDENQSFKYPGKFLAFTESGLKTKRGRSIGIDSLQELGITHVQLQPVYDYVTVNELCDEYLNYTGKRYNWGYDPGNYNVPEGYYSTNCHDPYSRIREFKQMVAALHEHKIGVIMDVVYNHTASVNDGPFEKIVPGYFYRHHEDGSFSDGAACNNEIASERPMVRKYIMDSLKYWVTEYGIDGFRFDLMGLLDTDLMADIAKELRSEIREDLILYGEPWQAGGSVLAEEKQTLKGSQRNLGFGVFNDNIRTAIKGSNREDDGAFVAGVEGFETEIVEGVCGSIHTITAQPSESLNYVTAHDDLNLWDKITYSYGMKEEEGFIDYSSMDDATDETYENVARNANLHHDVVEGKELDNERVRSCILANGIVLTSQGIPFFHAGDEFLRSKFGDHNSFISPDCINKIRWDEKDRFHKVFQYYQGLIQLRKEHPAFCMMYARDVEKHISIVEQKNKVVAFLISDYANHDLWKEILVIYNADRKERVIKLPKTAAWNVVVDEKTAGCKRIKTIHDDMITVAPISMLVAYLE